MQLIKNEHLQPIKKIIIECRKELAERKRQDLADVHNIGTDLTTFRINLLTFYAESIVLEKDRAAQMLYQWGQEMSSLLVEHGLPIDIALEEISFYRDIIGQIIKTKQVIKNSLLMLFMRLFPILIKL
ncbi:hypothetical protein ABEP18_31765 [Priestia megaterium]